MPPANQTDGLCRVRGQWINADGKPAGSSFRIRPEHGGMYKGRVYNGLSIEVPVDASGRWEAALPPSSVLGSYEFVFQSQKYTVKIPDDLARVEFYDLL
jgi:hypothetical protein